MQNNTPNTTDIPIKIVGSNVYGRYPKISSEQTVNMIVSNGFLVSFSGYKKVLKINSQGRGRDIFNSTRYKHMIVVVDNEVFQIDGGLIHTKIAELDTYSGDVFMDENESNQIGICDQSNIYIFNHQDGSFQKATTDGSTPLDFLPGYISYQNGYFIASSLLTPEWRLSSLNNGTIFPVGSFNTGEFQTKADNTKACIRFPGQGNLLFVMGNIVTELWQDLGLQLFPYQKNTSSNIDYGVVNQAVIGFSDKFVVWLGRNEKSGLAILYSDGGSVNRISNDGIDFQLEEINKPEKSYASMFMQAGHLFYQITFYDPSDNLTLLFDFNEKKFYTLTDEYQNYHIAKKVIYFNNKYYFISINDGDLYELSSDYTTYDYSDGKVATIPRIRIPDTVRAPNSEPFIVNEVNFILEEGLDDDSRVDLSISNDGGTSFGNFVQMRERPLGKKKNKMVYWNCGYSNEFITQFRFLSRSRVVVGGGTVGIY